MYLTVSRGRVYIHIKPMPSKRRVPTLKNSIQIWLINTCLKCECLRYITGISVRSSKKHFTKCLWAHYSNRGQICVATTWTMMNISNQYVASITATQLLRHVHKVSITNGKSIQMIVHWNLNAAEATSSAIEDVEGCHVLSFCKSHMGAYRDVTHFDGAITN